LLEARPGLMARRMGADDARTTNMAHNHSRVLALCGLGTEFGYGT
jgi:hypothetical protein